jgi:hypothetical protein
MRASRLAGAKFGTLMQSSSAPTKTAKKKKAKLTLEENLNKREQPKRAWR